MSGPSSSSSSAAWVNGVCVLPGASALSRMPSSAHTGAWCRTHLAERELDARVRDATRCRQRDRGRLVAREARRDQVVVDGGDGCRARADGDGGWRVAPAQRVAEPFEHRDAAEIADAREQAGGLDGRWGTGEPGVAVEAAGAGFEHSCDRGGAAVLRREVGHDLGVVQVDADDSMSVALECGARCGADARSGAGEGDGRQRVPLCRSKADSGARVRSVQPVDKSVDMSAALLPPHGSSPARARSPGAYQALYQTVDSSRRGALGSG